jgi:hypothetical protein
MTVWRDYYITSNPVTGPVVAQRVGSGIALLFHNFGTRKWWVYFLLEGYKINGLTEVTFV